VPGVGRPADVPETRDIVGGVSTAARPGPPAATTNGARPGDGPGPDGPDAPATSLLRPLLAGALVGLALSIALTLLRGDALWGSSEGVYALTARQLLDGDDLYGRLVAAQPPLTLLAGVPPLLASDTIGAIHTWMGLLQLAGGCGAAVAVARMTGSRVATALTPVAAVLLPWAVNQHGVYTPELVGLPFLAFGAVTAARRRTAPWAGILLALAVFVKLPFAIPALAVALVAADRRRTLTWLVAAGVAQAVAYTALFGPAMWEQTVLAQGQSGLHALGAFPGTVLQSAWTLLAPLAGCALLAVALLRRGSAQTAPGPADPVQLRVSAALAAGTAVTWLSTLKVGTSLNVLVPIELTLLPLAAAGAVVAWRGGAALPRRAARATLVTLGVVALAQSAAVLVPPHDAFPWSRPGSSPVYGQTASRDEVRAKLTAARGCPADAPYGGLAYYAFLAGRRMPDGQPDTFLTQTAPRLADVRARMAADGPACGG
jgi:hypothetical protein